MRNDDGAVLAFVILLMLALLVLAHGALVASLSEVAGSRAAVRDLELRSAARWALATVLVDTPPPWRDSVGTWETREVDLGDVGGIDGAGALTRLGPESWLVTGRARSPRGAVARTTRLAWTLDPLERVIDLRGFASVAPGAAVGLAGSADATRPAEVRAPLSAGACDAWSGSLAARYASEPLPIVAELADSNAVPALGLLDLGALMELAPVTVSGTGTPSAAEAAGACLEDAPWGWGDPDRPWGACGGHLPMRSSGGDLVVSGGAGQGVLIVGGDLRLTGAARYYGMVLVGGQLVVEGGARLEGMAVAAGGVLLGSGSTLTASACWAVRALDAQREALGGWQEVSAGGPIGPW